MKSITFLTFKEVDMAINKGKYLFGICKVGEKGQIVIPREARKIFDIKSGDSLVLFGDEKRGLALVKAEVFSGVAESIMGGSNDESDRN